MTNEKWLEGWSAVRERGMALHVLIGAACGFVAGTFAWLADEAYWWATGAYLVGDRNSPYAAMYWAALWAIAHRIIWALNERKYRRLTKATGTSEGLEPPAKGL